MKTTKTKFTKNLHIILSGLFATTVLVSTVQAIELVEIEPIDHKVIMADAKMDLGLSLKIMPLKLNSAQLSAQELLAKQTKNLNSKESITLAKTTRISE